MKRTVQVGPVHFRLPGPSKLVGLQKKKGPTGQGSFPGSWWPGLRRLTAVVCAITTGKPRKKGPSGALRARSRRGGFDQIVEEWQLAQFQILDACHARHAVVIVHPAFPPAIDPAGSGFKAAKGTKIPGLSFQARLIASGIGAGNFVSLLSFHGLFLIKDGGKVNLPWEQSHRVAASRKRRSLFTRPNSVSASPARLSNTKLQYHEEPLGISRILIGIQEKHATC